MQPISTGLIYVFKQIPFIFRSNKIRNVAGVLLRTCHTTTKGNDEHFPGSSEKIVSSSAEKVQKQKLNNAPDFFVRNPCIKVKTVASASTSSSISSSIEKKKMESLKKTDDKIIWVDCEMTGLNIEKDVIMEVACIITDGNLKEIVRHPSIIVRVSDDVLSTMSEWCLKHHGESGLTYACKNSNVTLEMADEMLANFVKKHTFPGICPLAGNSIYMDRIFLSKQMPKFHCHMHYRNIDVSTIKELVRRWFPKEHKSAPSKEFAHRVISDIEESIAELNYYRSTVFCKNDENKTN